MKLRYRAISALHWLYKCTVSPFLGDNCRFIPSCSDYALEALQQHGFFRGGYLALRRIIRCNPWGTGGEDFVPPPKKRRTTEANR